MATLVEAPAEDRPGVECRPVLFGSGKGSTEEGRENTAVRPGMVSRRRRLSIQSSRSCDDVLRAARLTDDLRERDQQMTLAADAADLGLWVWTTSQDAAEMLRLHADLAHAARVSTMTPLASSLAHELNQPLGAILRNAEAAQLLLQSRAPDLEEIRAILADICKDDHRAGEVIDHMRALLKRRGLERVELDRWAARHD